MSRYQYSELEKEINKILLYQKRELESICFSETGSIDGRISESEELLLSLGYHLPHRNSNTLFSKQVMVVPAWERLCLEADQAVESDVELESIFTDEEIRSNALAIQQLRKVRGSTPDSDLRLALFV